MDGWATLCVCVCERRRRVSRDWGTSLCRFCAWRPADDSVRFCYWSAMTKYPMAIWKQSEAAGPCDWTRPWPMTSGPTVKWARRCPLFLSLSPSRRLDWSARRWAISFRQDPKQPRRIRQNTTHTHPAALRENSVKKNPVQLALPQLSTGFRVYSLSAGWSCLLNMERTLEHFGKHPVKPQSDQSSRPFRPFLCLPLNTILDLIDRWVSTRGRIGRVVGSDWCR